MMSATTLTYQVYVAPIMVAGKIFRWPERSTWSRYLPPSLRPDDAWSTPS